MSSLLHHKGKNPRGFLKGLCQFPEKFMVMKGPDNAEYCSRGGEAGHAGTALLCCQLILHTDW